MEPKSPGGDKEGSTSIELGLGIGAAHGGGGGGGGVIKEGKSAFTAAQLHELQQQRLVLNYLVEGLPVPHHLIVPIWKSVAKSFGPANGGIYNQYPTFIGFNHQGFDYKGTMDPEPSRCRRTDGKKWRCSKEVVPHQKYCERHMHRGRNRPKKSTEASVSTPEPSLVLSPNCAKTNTESSKSAKTKSKEPVPVTVKLELATPSSNTTSRTPVGPANGSHESQNEVSMKDSIPVTEESIDGSGGSQKQKDTASTIVTTTGTGGSDNNLTVKNAAAITASSSGGVSKDQSTVVVKKETAPTTSIPHIGGDVLGIRKDGLAAGKVSAAAPTSTGYMNQIGSNTVKKETVAFMTKKDIRGRGETDVIITSTATSSTAAAEINCNRRVKSDIDETKYAEYDHSNTRVSTWSNNDASSWRFVSLAPPGFGLSPNSVLQVAGGGNPHRNSDGDVVETELTRCRRTDGKKWRCSKEVIPDEKYCGRHMHRGAKKLAVGVTSLQSVTVATAPPPSTSGVYHDPPLAIPKKATNLNTELSISIASSSQQGGEGEDSPSSSDATTITDENGSIAHLLVLSP